MTLNNLFITAITAITLSTGLAQAEPFKIQLSEGDQSKLTRELSKIGLKNRREEIVQETPVHIVSRSYNFMDNSSAFYISCSEQFMNFSNIGSEQTCEIGFNYEVSQKDSLETHDGFMADFAMAEIKNSQLAEVLYKTIGNGTSPKVFFNSNEQLVFIHPTTGKKFPAFRLRIDCQRNEHWSQFSCIISAVK